MGTSQAGVGTPFPVQRQNKKLTVELRRVRNAASKGTAMAEASRFLASFNKMTSSSTPPDSRKSWTKLKDSVRNEIESPSRRLESSGQSKESGKLAANSDNRTMTDLQLVESWNIIPLSRSLRIFKFLTRRCDCSTIMCHFFSADCSWSSFCFSGGKSSSSWKITESESEAFSVSSKNLRVIQWMRLRASQNLEFFQMQMSG